MVDLDWSNITAVDILAVMRSFAPEGGAGGSMKGVGCCRMGDCGVRVVVC